MNKQTSWKRVVMLGVYLELQVEAEKSAKKATVCRLEHCMNNMHKERALYVEEEGNCRWASRAGMLMVYFSCEPSWAWAWARAQSNRQKYNENKITILFDKNTININTRR